VEIVLKNKINGRGKYVSWPARGWTMEIAIATHPLKSGYCP